MTTFDDRERGYEAHFALDQEQEFKAQARRDRMIALWAGEKMGVAGDDLQNYVLAVMRADLKEPGDNDVFEKVLEDFEEKGVKGAGPELRAKMDEFLNIARTEIRDGK